ncbi:hypothetical protein FACS1894123_10840 [Bacteroidia bacterium]|nr:hypothetical protein FACS1894123_10840 [Bacteroidia bacterium]
MITLTDFRKIDDEVQNAIASTLDGIKTSAKEGYILYLANGDYRKELDNPSSKLNPNVIDYQGYLHLDETRLKFLEGFLKTFYSFPRIKLTLWGKFLSIFNSALKKSISDERTVPDDELRMNIEFMIYSHTWESENFLKDLYRLAILVDTGNYAWNIEVPPMGKHDFIRKNIRDTFKKKNNPITNIITKSFHTSIRNAFAHSQYYFNAHNKTIWLDNYKGASWELRNLSFDEWTKRFVYSTLLTYYMLNIKHENKFNIAKDFGTNIFTIALPPNSKNVNIVYDSRRKVFNFETQYKA